MFEKNKTKQKKNHCPLGCPYGWQIMMPTRVPFWWIKKVVKWSRSTIIISWLSASWCLLCFLTPRALKHPESATGDSHKNSWKCLYILLKIYTHKVKLWKLGNNHELQTWCDINTFWTNVNMVHIQTWEVTVVCRSVSCWHYSLSTRVMSETIPAT